MKITLYGRDVDADVWEWAKERAWQERNSLSRLVIDALRALRDDEETAKQQARNEPNR